MQTKVFRDFDAFAASVHDVESRFLLRNPGSRLWSVEAVNVEDVTAQVGCLGSGNIAQGELRAGGHMLYVPLTRGVDYWANGELLDENSVVVLDPGCEFCISTSKEHDWCTVFIPDKYLTSALEDSSSASDRRATCRVASPSGNVAGRFRALVQQIIGAGRSSSEFESLPAARSAANEVIDVALTALGAPKPQDEVPNGRPRFPRREIIEICMETMKEYRETPLRVRDLAAAADVSERTLRAVFRDYFQVGPATYLQLRTLNQIHHALRRADPAETTVAQVCMQYGEWALGRFASRYRDLYGVLPSETLGSREH